MKNKIILSIVAIICTLALCITYACSNSLRKNTDTKAAYISEQEAAEYIGIDSGLMKIMRENLKYFEGAYMSYSFVNSKNETETVIVYNRAALDKVMTELMKDKNLVNFTYLQEVYDK